MTGDEQADIVRLRAESMTMQVVIRALLHAMARSEPDGGAGLLADLTSNIERLTTENVMVNADHVGREFIRQKALKFVAGLLHGPDVH